ncbi:MAG: GGDEF and EAL domain-containing protein [Lachnospiraceae bacterium]|nr:GGDEF and EAL domain-containing protein [Lachnospiraceae bacterium]MDD7629320.1 GGDEF and EAL domain-containing protein [Lachnospiraceae bacterium]MDY4119612.1 GGDEF and EAL domain-containing protein [Lachnospiraceae bacterium]
MEFNNEGLDNIFFESLCKISEDYYFMENETGRSRWSPTAVNDFDLPGEYVNSSGAIIRSLVHPDDLKRYDAEISRIKNAEIDFYQVDYRMRKRNGDYIKVGCRGNVIRNNEGRIIWFTGVITRLNGEVDPTTQIANVYVAARDIMETFKNSTAKGALMYLGIDNFKRINDLYTFSGGDEVIKKLALKLKGIIPPSAMLYRIDGDRFAVHYPYAVASDMQAIYNRAAEEAKEIRLSEKVDVSLTLSAGVCIYPQNAETPEKLRRNTQRAFERAKREGKNQITFYSQEIREQYIKKLRFTEVLKHSVKENFKGFELYYQPIVDPVTRKIVECEALLRWKNDEFPKASPADFIPILEETGLIKEVGEWVVENAISQVKQWEDKNLIVNVNVSYKQLKDGNFAEYVLKIIDEYGYDPTKLVIELTESCKAHDISLLMKTLDKLREQHVLVALDDFGTGYASLDVLQDVSADLVKIEQKFVSGCRDNKVDRNIVKHIILLAHSLDMKVCMEGVETEEICQVAEEEKADTLQGYYFSRPVPAEEFGRMLQGNR